LSGVMLVRTSFESYENKKAFISAAKECYKRL
jgi:hypothetical protein